MDKTKINVEIKQIETGVTMISLTYLGKTYTTGAMFSDEIGHKVQVLIDKALEEYQNNIYERITITK